MGQIPKKYEIVAENGNIAGDGLYCPPAKGPDHT
jgi:hypothetical protein